MKIVDELGAIKATLADLQKKHDQLVERVKLQFFKESTRVLEGDLFRATFVVTTRAQLDTKRAAVLLPITTHPELYSQTLSESIRVVARNGKPLVEEERV